MSKSPLDAWDSIYVSPILMMLNQYFDNMVPELTMLYICTVSGFVLFYFIRLNVGVWDFELMIIRNRDVLGT
jgi:hypothetical protein